ncbi:MAG: glycerol-3-phosphate transporter permease, partial [Comamonas sp.]|nr:glycerol-3-phosphate transporter permease [Comamonas sp.]
MEKRVLFRSQWLPWALILPQLLIIAIFFFWPAGQAVLQSFQMEDAFGLSTEWVGLENYRNLFSDATYLNAFQRTALFSVLVAGIGIAASLGLAIFADRIIRFAMIYKTLLIVPYAVAPVIAGVLWVFMFSPSIGVVTHYLGKLGYDWNHLMN